jgi:hypothetical protein
MHSAISLSVQNDQHEHAEPKHLASGKCAACGRESNDLLGFFCRNSFTLPDGKELTPLSEGSCGYKKHKTMFCSDCFILLFRNDPPKEKLLLLVDIRPEDPCRGFEYLIKTDLEANQHGERERLEKNRALYAPRQPEASKREA